MNVLIRDFHALASRISRCIRLHLFSDPPPGLQLALVEDYRRPEKVDNEASRPSILQEIFDGFLLAVPKHRRNIETRLKRKFGAENWGPEARKMLRPKTNIKCCETCGNFHEAQYLCDFCYQKVKEETDAVHKAIDDSFKLGAREEEVAIVYRNEKKEKLANRRFVEVDKERPPWFSKNLLPKTVGEPLTEKNVIVEPEKATFKE